MQAASEPLKHMAAADLDVVKQELDSLHPRAQVYQKRVGNSNLFYWTPRPSIEAAVNGALLFQDAQQYPSTRSMLESLGQPIPSEPSSRQDPSTASAHDGGKEQQQQQQQQGAVQRSSSTGSKGKGKGKRKSR